MYELFTDMPIEQIFSSGDCLNEYLLHFQVNNRSDSQ